jgi:hypothetical protein
MVLIELRYLSPWFQTHHVAASIVDSGGFVC